MRRRGQAGEDPECSGSLGSLTVSAPAHTFHRGWTDVASSGGSRVDCVLLQTTTWRHGELKEELLAQTQQLEER